MDTDNKTDPVEALRCEALFGLWRCRIEEVPEFRSYYIVLFRRVGIIFKVAMDGTPWTRKGREYIVDCEGSFFRAALGKYAIGILKRLLPNHRITNIEK